MRKVVNGLLHHKYIVRIDNVDGEPTIGREGGESKVIMCTKSVPLLKS